MTRARHACPMEGPVDRLLILIVAYPSKPSPPPTGPSGPMTGLAYPPPRLCQRTLTAVTGTFHCTPRFSVAVAET